MQLASEAPLVESDGFHACRKWAKFSHLSEKNSVVSSDKRIAIRKVMFW